MRAIALAAAAASLALMGAAHARPWSDPGGRFTFDLPAGWSVQQRAGAGPNDTYSYVIAGTANNECQIMAVANAASAAVPPDQIRAQGGEQARFGADVWTRALTQFNNIFRGAPAQIASTSIDASGFWPIARAEARAGERPVHGAIQLRPGVDIIAACLTFEGAEPISLYDQVIRSVGHPNDAALRAAAEAAPAAPQPAAAPGPAAPGPR